MKEKTTPEAERGVGSLVVSFRDGGAGEIGRKIRRYYSRVR